MQVIACILYVGFIHSAIAYSQSAIDAAQYADDEIQ